MSVTYIPARLRRLVVARARNRCEYCLSPDAYSTFPFHVDHVVPENKGGSTTEDNLAYSCGCNGFKGHFTEGLDAQTGSITPLFHPRLDRWQYHFAWSEDNLEVVGLTAKGRVTIILLQMNRPGLAGLRRLLISQGEHPSQEE